ncbi:MAG: GTP cyclohydrolase I FolE [Parvularculales bacterium]
MDIVTHPQSFKNKGALQQRPSREEAEQAVRTLIAWAGDNPDREGLVDTPARVVRAYEEYFKGYDQDPHEDLNRTFEEVEGYQDMVMLRNITIESHCEHHIAPFLGTAHVAYVPNGKVVGISKLARLVEIFSRRLQTQETLTMQIANTLEDSIEPLGVATLIDAKHQCMTTRGIHKPDASTITSHFTGVFRENHELERRFITMAGIE